MTKRFEEARHDVASSFDRPRAVVDDPGLELSEKVTLLEQWAYDLEELSRAAGENMTGGNSDEQGDLLTEAENCLRDLKAKRAG